VSVRDGADNDARVVSIGELAGYLGAAIGDAKAREVIVGAARKLGYGFTGELRHAEALKVLEMIAETKGLVGLAARFTKSRLYLQWGVDDTLPPNHA
jgi:hypothetical protein